MAKPVMQADLPVLPGTLDGRLELASDLARQAGAQQMRAFRRSERMRVIQKTDRTPVSPLDRKLERALRDGIRRQFPNDIVRGEELGTDAPTHIPTPDACLWILDPLDGTRNFLAGLPSFCVSIAIVRNRRPLAAVVYDPLHEELFFAADGQGATLNGHPLTRPVANALLPFGWSHSPGTPYGSFLAGLEEIRAAGRQAWDSGSASIMLCYVAAGRLAGCAEVALPIWDTLPGLLIAREAGYDTSALHVDAPTAVPGPMFAHAPDCAALAQRLARIGQCQVCPE